MIEVQKLLKETGGMSVNLFMKSLYLELESMLSNLERCLREKKVFRA